MKPMPSIHGSPKILQESITLTLNDLFEVVMSDAMRMARLRGRRSSLGCQMLRTLAAFLVHTNGLCSIQLYSAVKFWDSMVVDERAWGCTSSAMPR
jgi:hypothetical protein